MTAPDPDAQRLRWVEREAGVYDEDEQEHGYVGEPDTLDWEDR